MMHSLLILLLLSPNPESKILWLKFGIHKYIEYDEHLIELMKIGFTAAVYTQPIDVEGEINGLMTYDRKIIKLEEDRLHAINKKVCKVLNE